MQTESQPQAQRTGACWKLAGSRTRRSDPCLTPLPRQGYGKAGDKDQPEDRDSYGQAPPRGVETGAAC